MGGALQKKKKTKNVTETMTGYWCYHFILRYHSVLYSGKLHVFSEQCLASGISSKFKTWEAMAH